MLRLYHSSKSFCEINTLFLANSDGTVDSSTFGLRWSCPSTTALTTVAKVRECISRFDCPHSIVTDNGTQFTSELFAKMCQEYGIEHVRTPAFHPQSNGQAERFVDTLKRALLKMGEKNPDEALLTFLETYRYTPNASLPQNKSPAEALLGRKIRTKFD
ncbi:uncharacterized protein K02A2.6-like [Uranotaenia lowii]|uniref:uncharacterized protein K02A2.6-like n=1 Tax=Uranotaenia lowii TaxID=190385 RepID=UPI00247ADC60|nr:uncharacterized protein K02A2.6-like [Uranotaenia lowii]